MTHCQLHTYKITCTFPAEKKKLNGLEITKQKMRWIILFVVMRNEFIIKLRSLLGYLDKRYEFTKG